MTLDWYDEHILHTSFVWGDVEFFLQMRLDDNGLVDLLEYEVGHGLTDDTMDEKAQRVAMIADEIQGLDMGSAQRFLDTFVTMEIESVG